MAALLAAASSAAGAGIGGAEFQVNTYTTSDQQCPSVAARPDGTFVVVWDSFGSSETDIAEYSVHMQVLDAKGDKVGTQMQVNQATLGMQLLPDVAVTPSGSFLVAWNSRALSGPDPDSWGVLARRYDSSAQPVGSEFLVNSYTTGIQRSASIAARSDGSFVVAWNGDDDGGEYGNFGVHARSIEAEEPLMGAPMLLNQYLPGIQNGVDIVMLSDARFLAVWHGDSTIGGTTHQAHGRLLDADTVPVGPELDLSGPSSTTVFPVALARSAGQFLAFWEEALEESIQGRRFRSDGAPMNEAFEVSTYELGDKERVSAAPGPRGEFVVTWHAGNPYVPNESPDGDLYAVAARFFTDSGPVGDEFVVNTYTTSAQREPDVAFGADGRVLVV